MLNGLSVLRQVSRPYFVFEFAQQSKCAATSCGKVSCRRGHCQQAAEVPHTALAAGVPLPASSLNAKGEGIQSKGFEQGNDSASITQNEIILQDNLPLF